MQAGQGGNGVEDPHRGFLTVETLHRFEDAVVVAGKGVDDVGLQGTDLVPAVVPEVVDDQVVVGRQQRPERVVEVDGEAVAVAQDEAGSRRIPVAPQDDDGGGVHLHGVGGQRPGYLPGGCR